MSNGADIFGMERMPPQSIEAEQAVLGAMMLSGKAIEGAADLLTDACFYHAPHALCFRALTKLYDRQEGTDIISLSEALRRRGQLDEVGGVLYLATLAGQVSTDANVLHHARLVREKATLRRIIEQSTRLSQRAYGATDDVETILHEAEADLDALQRDTSVADWQSFEDVYHEALSALERAVVHPELLQGVMSGLPKLDEMTNGFQPGELIILAARPSVGKSAFAFQIAYQAAGSGGAVALFSLEMSRLQVTQRLASLASGVPLACIRTGRGMQESDWAHLTRTSGKLAALDLWIDDRSALTHVQIASALRRLVRTRTLKLVIIDYLQLMAAAERTENRQQEVAAIIRSLKGMGKEFHVPLVALAQLSRKPEERSDKRPVLSDIRETGEGEQTADVVLLLHRPDLYGLKTSDGNPASAEVIVAKQRNGPTGTVHALWDAPCAQFLPANEWEAAGTFDHANND